jgi:1-acyl-sn-glycerol-3-phosphate acyltransferase
MRIHEYLLKIFAPKKMWKTRIHVVIPRFLVFLFGISMHWFIIKTTFSPIKYHSTRSELLKKIYKIIHWSLGFSSIKVLNEDKKPFTGDLKNKLMVSNHTGYVELYIISTLVCPVAFISKKSMENIPYFGAILKASGSVFVDRHDRDSKETCKKYVQDNMDNQSWLVFPEGTTNSGSNEKGENQLLPFHSVVFDINRPITPVVFDFGPSSSLFALGPSPGCKWLSEDAKKIQNSYATSALNMFAMKHRYIRIK